MEWRKIHYPFAKTKDDSDWKARLDLFKEFIEFFQFDKMAYPEQVGSYERLLYGKRSYNNTKCELGTHYRVLDSRVPDNDHAILLKTTGTTRFVYVNQPYQFDKEKLEYWCNGRDLIYLICDKKYSFYYPENTEMILIMSNDTYIDFLNLPGFPWKWEKLEE